MTRPASRPRRPNQAARALAAFRQADADIAAAQQARDEAFRDMVRAGMTVYAIAKATGLGDGSVRYWLRSLGLEPYKTGTMPPKTPRKAIKRRAESGSILFGD